MGDPEIQDRLPRFRNESAARERLASLRWPDYISKFCPLCGAWRSFEPLGGESMGEGWYHCAECRNKFTVRAGTIMQHSQIPLSKWLYAIELSEWFELKPASIKKLLDITDNSARRMVRLINAYRPKRAPIGWERWPPWWQIKK